MKRLNLLIALVLLTMGLMAQNGKAKKSKMTRVKKPVLIMGETEPVKTEAWGLAHPSVYDWNQDGKKDLVIGEFEGKAKFRVYLNVGTDSKPVFSDKWFYGHKADGEELFVTTG